MPVSRKRKKKSPSGRGPARQSAGPTPSRHALTSALDEVFEHRRKLAEHRAALAGDAAGAMVDALVAAAAGWSDDDLEDDLCARFGAAMIRYAGSAVEDLVNPEDFVAALLAAIDERLAGAVETGADPAALRRLLTVVAGVLPAPLGESARELVAEHVGAGAATRAARGRALTGPVVWARDAYGSRRAVVAPFASAGGADRWYLWDVDTCGIEAVTVHSGFHASAEAALAAWRESVGAAAAGASLAPADDGETLAGLLPGELEETRLGGEDQRQYAEFLRSRRLGGTARKAARGVRGRGSVRLTAEEARELFAERLRQLGHPDQPAGGGSAGSDELAAALADSWPPQQLPTLYPYCSPHKVALLVLAVRDYYGADFAAEVVAVLPEWIRFLAERTGQAAELTERCLAYASGEVPFPGSLDDQGGMNLMARVAE